MASLARAGRRGKRYRVKFNGEEKIMDDIVEVEERNKTIAFRDIDNNIEIYFNINLEDYEEI
jgi:predicted RNA-binding protein